MTKPEMYAFIERKAELVLGLTRKDDPSIGLLFTALTQNLATGTWPEQSYLLADREIEEVIQDQSSSVAETVGATLRKEFGFARLGESPKRVMAKVLKRGKAASEQEAAVVRDALAGDFGELSEDVQKRLAKVMRDFDDGRSR